MNEILTLSKNSSDSFYLGKDKEGWEFFSKLIEQLQFYAVDETLDINFKNDIMEFINKLERIIELKEQKNYTLIGDILYENYNKFLMIKELN